MYDNQASMPVSRWSYHENVKPLYSTWLAHSRDTQNY
jgi:hypothetical protein